jgi:hypothetical protein
MLFSQELGRRGEVLGIACETQVKGDPVRGE